LNIGHWIQRQSKLKIFALATFLFLLDEYIDYRTGPELNVSFFHLVPVFLIVWNSGLLPGLVYDVFCTCVILFVSLQPAGLMPNSVQVFNALANLIFLGAFTVVLSLLKKHLEQVTARAELDGLTNLLNSTSFTRRAEQEVLASTRSRRPFTILYIDVDNFKTVNDTLGHGAGDEVLKSVGKFLAGQFRKGDLRTRIGGDEFAVFLPDYSLEEAKRDIPPFHEALNRILGAGPAPISCSIGGMTFTQAPPSLQGALHEADMLMYRVKMGGKNNYRLGAYSPPDPIPPLPGS
jgi:diguanylate cyclase (GGDEF)-like protein